jgi:hypothetical protein
MSINGMKQHNTHMHHIKLKSTILTGAILALSAGCGISSSGQDSGPLQNTLPIGGKLLEQNKESGLLNIDDVEGNLDERSLDIFRKSLEWYAAETDLGLEHFIGMTARQSVDLVNCIKTSPPESQDGCLQADHSSASK